MKIADGNTMEAIKELPNVREGTAYQVPLPSVATK